MNKRNTAVKRILADVRELERHKSSRYTASPLEDNMFEWHFTIRGPQGTDFEGGVYHGRILLPPEYPFKPPNIIFLNKNGRFEVGTKICLSISAYHEESWQPAWGVRTMLEAIISFLPTEGAGAIGALDWSKEERKKLATESHNYCCQLCGNVASLLSDPSTDENTQQDPDIVSQISQLSLHAPQSADSPAKSERVTKIIEETEIIEEVSGQYTEFNETAYGEMHSLQNAIDSIKLTKMHLHPHNQSSDDTVEDVDNKILSTNETSTAETASNNDIISDNINRGGDIPDNQPVQEQVNILRLIEAAFIVLAIILIIITILIILLRKLKRFTSSSNYAFS
eukprot:CAMPEP_0196761770 /NCGR_PEP_ID=MMETSP1095-20130614/1068_1 /TAXON_ID=96789 ORGANISM="Chromulina nebulosa, Strain UTEXLB2642" /NCGR_SAMPLE_ID=MMETSP1095 /ASSEMBLY_ACC=CAM_ASM_000446 /LENGTH=338 /DNA_ID=CAMNT_0042111713 /DNA_START=16 /DNA_END=1029 /DNA_ORIENTATION=+